MTRHRLVTGDGVAIAWDELGPADGQAVVLCHGLAASGRHFADDAAYFADLGYRVLVPDLRGHGDSGKAPAARPEQYTIARLAADLVQVLDAAGAGQVHWVGNSLGGIVALHLLAAHAGRFRTLVTFGTAFALNLPVAATYAIPLSYAVLGRRLTGMLTAAGTSRNPATRRVIRDVLETYDPAVGLAVATNLARYDLIANGAETDVPMLMLRGDRDTGINLALPRTLEAMRGRPQFSLVEVPAAGHCANLDAPAAVRAAILRFWRAH